MVRMCKYNTHSIKMDEAYNALNLLGQSACLPDGTHNLAIVQNALPALRRAAAERGRKKKIFFSKIKTLVSGGGWQTISDIGIEDFRAILRRIYSLPELDQDIRGERSSGSIPP